MKTKSVVKFYNARREIFLDCLHHLKCGDETQPLVRNQHGGSRGIQSLLLAFVSLKMPPFL